MPVPKGSDPKQTEVKAPPAPKPERKVWKKKTPVEVVLEQADKLKAEIAEMEEELKPRGGKRKKSKEPKKLSKGCRHVAAGRSAQRPLAAALRAGGRSRADGLRQVLPARHPLGLVRI